MQARRRKEVIPVVSQKDQTKENILDQLNWDGRIDASGIRVEVSDGKVTLSGIVPNLATREIAEADCFCIRSVKEVENLLVVRSEEISMPSDDRTRENIHTMLKWSPELYASDIDISVIGGRVTLEGSVENYWKKIRAGDIAASVYGVTDVINKLTVVPTDTISDKRIAEDIVAALDRNIMVNAEDVHVKVTDGNVLLSGAVPSWNARQAAYRTAQCTRGVSNVKIRLSVEQEEGPFHG
jgi:osmotically-inducible protein OsmY